MKSDQNAVYQKLSQAFEETPVNLKNVESLMNCVNVFEIMTKSCEHKNAQVFDYVAKCFPIKTAMFQQLVSSEKRIDILKVICDFGKLNVQAAVSDSIMLSFPDLLKLALDCGCIVPAHHKQRALKLACRYGRMDIVEPLVRMIEHDDRQSYFPWYEALNCACKFNHLQVAMFIIQYVKEKDRIVKALPYTCFSGDLNLFQWLRQCIQHQNCFISLSVWESSFVIACVTGRFPVIQLIDRLSEGIKLESHNFDLVWQTVCSKGYLEIVDFFLNKTQISLAHLNKGMYKAYQQEHYNIMLLLGQHGATISNIGSNDIVLGLNHGIPPACFFLSDKSPVFQTLRQRQNIIKFLFNKCGYCIHHSIIPHMSFDCTKDFEKHQQQQQKHNCFRNDSHANNQIAEMMLS